MPTLRCIDGVRGVVVDEDTGLTVRHVIWLDTDRGELEAYKVDGNGNPVKTTATDGATIYYTYKARGKFRFLPMVVSDGKLPNKPLAMGADKCAKCPSVLTLPGDELCVACRAADRLQRNKMRVEPITTPLLHCRCAHYGCGLLATWSVGDEVDASPVVGNLPNASRMWGRAKKALYTRGATVGRRYYCSKHFQPPRLLDPRGEVIADFDNVVRPD